ncbi:hypothetical protein D3C86_1920330 [compost metagenome]
MPHRHQLEHAVVDAEYHVARKVDALHVLGHLLVAQVGAETQQAVGLLQCDEMLQHAPPVALGQFLDHHGRPVLAALQPAP